MPDKVIVIDLDGTICEQVPPNADGSPRDYSKAIVKPKVVEFLKKAKAAGWNIQIYTARGQITYQGNLERIYLNLRAITQKWLKDNDVTYDHLFFGKPPANVYIDDKSLHPSIFDRVSAETVVGILNDNYK
jgi:capsule biosynthesis phosphatase